MKILKIKNYSEIIKIVNLMKLMQTLIFVLIFHFLFSYECKAIPMAMSHQANTYYGNENPELIYLYRNVIASKYKFQSPVSLFAFNVFDYENQTTGPGLNRPLFGGGKTNSLFTGVAFSLSKNFSLKLHDANIWLYADNRPFDYMNILYLDPEYRLRQRSAIGIIELKSQFRSVYYITPIRKYDFREKLEVSMGFLNNHLKLLVGNEISINIIPAGYFQSNDFYSTLIWSVIGHLDFYMTINWEYAGSQNYFNMFAGMRFSHPLYTE